MSSALTGNEHTPAERLVATVGNFDGVHRGHVHLIERVRREARARGLSSAVVTFRNHPASVLHPDRPVQLLWPMMGREKTEALRATGIDRVIWLDFTPAMAAMSSTQFIEWLHREHGVDVLVMGYNHRLGHDRSGLADGIAPTVGVEIVHADEYAGPEAPVSSSLIRDLIARGDVKEAARKWGRAVTLSGTVVDGRKNGRKLGFPTANIRHADDQVWPPVGAYAALVTIDERPVEPPLLGMVGVTRRPTLTGDSSGTTGAEVHIFDFDGDLYRHRVSLELVEQLRPERRFADLAALRQQLSADREQALAVLRRHLVHRSSPERTENNHFSPQ